MRIAYFDCFAGASGDMILGALVDAGVAVDGLQAELRKVAISGYRLEAHRVTRRGIAATAVQVIDEAGTSYPPQQMLAAITSSGLPPAVRQTATRIVERLVAAEAKVHGVSPEEVHLHELSRVDTLVDVVGAVGGLALLDIDRVYISPVNVGSGMVRGEHGLLPVPAPATMELLRGVPCFGAGEGEATTPTGAAILTTLAARYGSWPMLSPERVGYGAGEQDGEVPNVLRLIVGAASEFPADEALVAIETNIDDMNPQFFEHVGDRLLARGAVDFFVTPVVMKKGRPGQLLTVLAGVDRLDEVVTTIFEETTTLGVRVQDVRRMRLQREEHPLDTPLGACRVKIAYLGGRVVNVAPEYEDCRTLARAHGLPLKEVYARMAVLAREYSAGVKSPGGWR